MGRVDSATEVALSQVVEITPAFDQWTDLPVVNGQGLGLVETVLLAAAGFAGMDMVDVQATVDVPPPTVDVHPAEEVLIVEDRRCGSVAANPLVEITSPSRNMVRRESDIGDNSW